MSHRFHHLFLAGMFALCVGASGSAQQSSAPREQPKQSKEAEPPEEDDSSKPKEYAFNPLQASKEIQVGEMYQGRVVTIKEFGCFVEVLPGKDGMVHISELADFRVNKVEDIVKMGDVIWVKCIGVDEKGRVKLSRKAAMKERGEAASAAPAAPVNA